MLKNSDPNSFLKNGVHGFISSNNQKVPWFFIPIPHNVCVSSVSNSIKYQLSLQK